MLQAAVSSLKSLARPEGWSFEVILVDNASADGARQWAEANDCRVLPLERNWGFGAAVNRGIDSSSGNFIVVMNDDVEFDADWLERTQQALQEDPQAWFACGKTLSYADRSRIDGAGDAVCRGGASWRVGHGRPDGAAFDVPRSVFFPSATATLFRRDFFNRVGRFDETFFAYLEDVELGLRAALAGLSGVYVPEARAYHHGSRTGGIWSAAMVRWITGHQIVLLAKFFPAGLLLRFGWNIFVSQLLWAGLAMRRRQTIAWARGMLLGARLAAKTGRNRETLHRSSEQLPGILTDSEAEIERFQQQTGFDAFWTWYFRLTGRLPQGRK